MTNPKLFFFFFSCCRVTGHTCSRHEQGTLVAVSVWLMVEMLTLPLPSLDLLFCIYVVIYYMYLFLFSFFYLSSTFTCLFSSSFFSLFSSYIVFFLLFCLYSFFLSSYLLRNRTKRNRTPRPSSLISNIIATQPSIALEKPDTFEINIQLIIIFLCLHLNIRFTTRWNVK